VRIKVVYRRIDTVSRYMEKLVPRDADLCSVPRLCHIVSARCSGFVMVYFGLRARFGCLLRDEWGPDSSALTPMHWGYDLPEMFTGLSNVSARKLHFL